MAHHPVLGPHREALEVPAAHERLPRGRLGVPAVVAHVLREARELGGGRDVAAQHAAGREGLGDRGEVLPGREHVEDDAVDRAGLDHGGQDVGEFTDAQVPGGVRAAEERLDVAPRDGREVLAPLDRAQRPAVADGAQQRERERAGADARLDDARTGEDVGHRDDLTGVLGVDDRGPAGHRQDVVGQQRPQRDVGGTARARDDLPLGRADQRVVREVPAVRVEGRAGLQRDGVQPALEVGELDLVAGAERPAPQVGTGRRGGGGHGGGRVVRSHDGPV